MSNDFEDVTPDFDEPVDALPKNQIRFTYMRIGIFVAAGASLLSLLFAFWAMIDKAHNPSIGAFLFTLISLAIQIMFLLSVYFWHWFDFRVNA